MRYLYSAILGLLFGSFSNVCILRLPADESLWFPRSHCPRCHRSLKAIHNIPVISYLVLKGRCGFCRSPISAQYPLIECIMALLFLFNAWHFSDSVDRMVIADVLSFYLSTLSLIDFRHRIIPDELSLSLLALGFLGSFANPYFSGSPSVKLVESLVAGIGGGLMMLIIAWVGEKAFKKEAMGGGDIKLVAATSAVLGWEGLIGPLMLGSLTGGLVALILLFSKKKKLGETLPFGPFLSLGAYVTCLFPGWCRYLFSQK